MNFYNPFNQMPQMPSPQMQMPQFDKNQFSQLAITLNQDSLNRLVLMARAQGISDNDIQAGLNIIQSLR